MGVHILKPIQNLPGAALYAHSGKETAMTQNRVAGIDALLDRKVFRLSYHRQPFLNGLASHHSTLKTAREMQGRPGLLRRTTLIPLPPPPMAAFNITGNPADSAKARASAAVSVAFSLPGITGTPHCLAISRAEVLSPKACTHQSLMDYDSVHQSIR